MERSLRLGDQVRERHHLTCTCQGGVEECRRRCREEMEELRRTHQEKVQRAFQENEERIARVVQEQQKDNEERMRRLLEDQESQEVMMAAKHQEEERAASKAAQIEAPAPAPAPAPPALPECPVGYSPSPTTPRCAWRSWRRPPGSSSAGTATWCVRPASESDC